MTPSAARRVAVDRSACRGAGECLFRAPASFRLDAEGRAEALDPPCDPPERLAEAVQSCPHFALRFADGE
ncbi:MAG: ferredoxin [Myxococcota bacterium]